MKTEPGSGTTVSVTDLQELDLETIIARNADALRDGYVLTDEKKGFVIVKDGNAADMKFRAAKPGWAVPMGTVRIGDSAYRRYMVARELL